MSRGGGGELRLDPTLYDRRSDEFTFERMVILRGASYQRRNTAIRAKDRASVPSGLPAPVQKQADRGFKPPLFPREFFAGAQQSHALG
jgi:hypothetical protein